MKTLFLSRTASAPTQSNHTPLPSACLALSMLLFGSLANAQVVTSWQGDVNTNWDTGGNWGNGVPDVAAGVIPAQFTGTFDDQPELQNASPWQTAEMIRVLSPNKDVVITVGSTRQLNIDTWDDNGGTAGGNNYGIDMRTAGRNLTITGGGDFFQRDNKINNGNPALWAVTSTNPIGGDLTIDVDVFRIENPVGELVIDTAAGRTVDIQARIAASADGATATTASITKEGDGTLIFGDVNNSTGKLAVNGGTLSVSNPNQFNNAPGALTADSVTLDGGTIVATANVGLTGTANARRGFTLGAGGGTLAPAAAVNFNIDAPITGTGDLTKSGEGTVLLRANTNNYTGDTFIHEGSLKMGTPGGSANDRLPVTTVLTIGNGSTSGTLDLNSQNQKLAGLSSSGTGTDNKVINGGSAKTLNLDVVTDFTFTGAIGGGGSGNNVRVQKDGVGAMSLLGANSHTQDTVINGGTLNVTTASTGADDYVLNNTGNTLGVSIGAPGETLNVKDLTVSAGGHNLDVTLDPAAPTAPVVACSGALTLNGDLTVNVSGMSIVTSGDEIVLLNYASLAGVGSIVEGSLPTISGYTRTFTHDTVNNKVTLTYTSTQGPIAADMVFPAAVSEVYGLPSGSTSVAVSGSSLSGDITATAPAGFEVSNDDSTFGPTAVFAQTAGSASGTLYIRIAAGSSVLGSYDDQLVR